MLSAFYRRSETVAARRNNSMPACSSEWGTNHSSAYGRFDGRRLADGLEKRRLRFEFWEQDRNLIEEARIPRTSKYVRLLADSVAKVENRTASKISRKMISRPLYRCKAQRGRYEGPWSFFW
jgi:hypothetical protein